MGKHQSYHHQGRGPVYHDVPQSVLPPQFSIAKYDNHLPWWLKKIIWEFPHFLYQQGASSDDFEIWDISGSVHGTPEAFCLSLPSSGITGIYGHPLLDLFSQAAQFLNWMNLLLFLMCLVNFYRAVRQSLLRSCVPGLASPCLKSLNMLSHPE